MDKSEIAAQIIKKASYLCIGLDTDIRKVPPSLLKTDDPVYEFNKRIIEATHDLCVAYKPNIAFYEAQGPKGWESLARTLEYIPDDIFTIADAKRGDIGNTSRLYATAFFETMDFDAITVAPYMGEDSVSPFLAFKDKWAIVLANTSNKGSEDFQLMQGAKHALYEEVILKSSTWGHSGQLMFVVGATQTERLQHIRALAPDHFFLVPGVGAQGGDLEAVSRYAMNKECGLLVNSSRGIIYASDGDDFATGARKAALDLQQKMSRYLQLYGK